MPKFTIKVIVLNNSVAPVKAHVGASLVGVADQREYYNTSEDITQVFPVGYTTTNRYLTSDLGLNQKYKLVVALWEGEKPIGHGLKYASITLKNAVEKKKKKIVVNLVASVQKFYPSLFVE